MANRYLARHMTRKGTVSVDGVHSSARHVLYTELVRTTHTHIYRCIPLTYTVINAGKLPNISVCIYTRFWPTLQCTEANRYLARNMAKREQYQLMGRMTLVENGRRAACVLRTSTHKAVHKCMKTKLTCTLTHICHVHEFEA